MGQVMVKKRVKVLVNVVVAKVGGWKEEEEEKLLFCWLAPLRLAGASKNKKHQLVVWIRRRRRRKCPSVDPCYH